MPAPLPDSMKQLEIDRINADLKFVAGIEAATLASKGGGALVTILSLPNQRGQSKAIKGVRAIENRKFKFLCNFQLL